MQTHSEAFAALFRRSHFTLVRYVFLRVNNRALAEDLAAETFAIAWEKTLAGETITVEWLFAAARNVIGNEYQRRDHERARVQFAALAELTRVDSWDVQIRSIELDIAMSRLRPADALVLQLTYWDGLDAGQAAQFLGCSRAALWVRLTRARAALRALLDSTAATRVTRPGQAGAEHE